jgi:hypothetical protein
VAGIDAVIAVLGADAGTGGLKRMVNPAGDSAPIDPTTGSRKFKVVVKPANVPMTSTVVVALPAFM